MISRGSDRNGRIAADGSVGSNSRYRRAVGVAGAAHGPARGSRYVDRERNRGLATVIVSAQASLVWPEAGPPNPAKPRVETVATPVQKPLRIVGAPVDA